MKLPIKDRQPLQDLVSDMLKANMHSCQFQVWRFVGNITEIKKEQRQCRKAGATHGVSICQKDLDAQEESIRLRTLEYNEWKRYLEEHEETLK